MNGSWSICRGNHRCLLEIEGDLLPYRLAVHREELWGLTIGLFLNGEKKHTIPWQSDLRAWRKAQRSPSSSTSMGDGSLSLSTSMGQRSPSLSTSMNQRFPFVSTSMEKGSEISILAYDHGSEISILVYEHGEWSCFFLIEKIDPLDSIILTRSFDPPSQIFLYTM